jgi:type II secretory pathway component PulC
MIVSRRRRADRLSGAALLCLAAGLCAAAWLALMRRPAPEEPSPAPAAPPPATAASPAKSAPDNLSVLWASASAASGTSAGQSSAAGGAASGDETPPFTIRGLIASLNGSSSCAFLQSSLGVPIIHQGEVVDGWKLTAVKGNAATFVKGSREVTLSLAAPEYAKESGTAPAPVAGVRPPAGWAMRPVPIARLSQQPPAPQSANSATVAAASASAGSAATKAADAEIAVPRSLADLARTNPGAVMQGVQIEPNMVNGQLQGFTVASVASGAVLAPYVAQGTSILAVNGTPITSVSSAFGIYQQLVASGSTSVTVTLERGGQRQNVVYYIK